MSGYGDENSPCFGGIFVAQQNKNSDKTHCHKKIELIYIKHRFFIKE